MNLKFTFAIILLSFSVTLFSQQPQKKTGKTTYTPQSKTKNSNQKTTVKPKTTPGKSSTNTIAKASATTTSSTNLTGVWRGYFVAGMGFFQERYKYEIQLGQGGNNGMKGVTYSYKTTVFYGKANLSGIYTPSTKNLVVKETKLVEVKIKDMSEPCLMTCYLEYSKIGGVEILEGTYTSVNLKGKNDCGSGKVYLEKVPESDFYKEEFVTEYETSKSKKTTTVTERPKKDIKVVPKSDTRVVVKPKTDKAKTTEVPKIIKIDPPVAKKDPPKEERRVTIIEVPRTDKKPTPKVLKEREKSLVKTLTVDEGEIVINLYDNGQIDNDTLTVYDNNQPVAWRQRLSDKPICIKIKVDASNPYHEISMVAENLGEIPPNTALMVVYAGNKRHELFITSTEQKNAVVVIELKIPQSNMK